MTSVAGHDWSGNWSFCDWLPDPATGCSCQSCKILTGNRTGSYQSQAKSEKVQSQPDFQTLLVRLSLIDDKKCGELIYFGIAACGASV